MAGGSALGTVTFADLEPMPIRRVYFAGGQLVVVTGDPGLSGLTPYLIRDPDDQLVLAGRGSIRGRSGDGDFEIMIDFTSKMSEGLRSEVEQAFIRERVLAPPAPEPEQRRRWRYRR